ncbi:MAG: hypothetical protein LUH10_10865 [Tannerellaceae bacterium]|nr:hypothetical protein [Tannerellaceae bacterium]
MGKKNWLRNLIFVDAEPDANKNINNPKENIPTAKPITESPAKSAATNQVSMPKIEKQIDPETIIGKVDKALASKLYSVFDEQSDEGTGIDFIKFKKATDSLKNIQPEEKIRYASTFLTLKVTNPALTKEYLIQTLEKCIGLIEQERKVGMEQLKGLRSKDIDKKNAEIEDARINVERMKAEIQRLSKFIAETEMVLVAKQNEIAIKEANFNATIDQIINQLKNDRTKIETYIQ